jgi:lipopolysaccharide transport system permease protein
MTNDVEFASPGIHRTEPVTERGTGVVRIARSILRHRWLVVEMARRELSDQHVGQLAGGTWLILHPIILFCVYAFLFTFVFKVRLGDLGPSDYLIYLFSGLAPWLLTQDSLVRTSVVMAANASIVKKVVFPMEVLIGKTIVASVFVQAFLMLSAIFYSFYERGGVPTAFILLPPLTMLHLLLLLGLGLFLGIMTPYFRDLPEFVRIFVVVNIYLIPVMYAPEMVPEKVRFILSINPFSHVVWCYQDILYFRKIAHPLSWVAMTCFAAGSVLVGSYVFVRLRHHVASVM